MFRYKLHTLLIGLAPGAGVLALFALGFIDSLAVFGAIGVILALAVCLSALQTKDSYNGGRVVRSPRPPSYEELRDLFLVLESPPDNDHFPYPDWIQLLVDAKLLNWRSAAHMGVTQLGREVAKRLRAGGEAPEIRRILDPKS